MMNISNNETANSDQLIYKCFSATIISFCKNMLNTNTNIVPQKQRILDTKSMRNESPQNNSRAHYTLKFSMKSFKLMSNNKTVHHSKQRHTCDSTQDTSSSDRH